ncbi:MAG: DsbC family protein [Desulfobacterales bacterium]|nr:DsbC family protein [Desulfobacterales bacterium]
MMKRYVKTFQRLLFGLMLLPFLLDPVYGQCPTPEAVRKGIANFAAKGVQIIAVRPTAYAEICEVHVRLQNRNQIFYAGSKGEFFLMGQLYDASSGRNLTRSTLETLTRFSPEEMVLLNDLTAFSIGNSGKTIYFATDPQCSYCKEGAEILKKIVSSGAVHVKFLLFPLSSHKGAREQSISVICDGKSLPEFESGYRSDNQCSDGIMKIEKTGKLLRDKGISGTPTYIFSDGSFHSGLIKEGELRSRLGLRISNKVE